MRRHLLLATTALLAASQHALAQEPAATPATALDRVTTTATRTPQVAGDVAAPVSVVPRAEMLRRQPGNLNDILSDLPGVEVDGLPRASVMQPQIRGLGDDRVIIQLDGVRQNFSAGHRGRVFVEPELLRQVDVLRGPASMLYGSGALGGVLNMRTIEADDIIRPGRATGFFLSNAYETNGGRWRNTVAGAARAGEVDALVAYSHRAGSNQQDATSTTIPYTDPTTHTVLGRLGWNPVPDMRIGLTLQQRWENEEIPVAANTVTATNIADRELTSQQLALSFGWAPAGMPLLDLSATLYRNAIEITETRIVPNDGRRDGTDLTTWGFSLQNTARFSLAEWDRHALTIGLDTYRDEQEGRRDGAVRGQYPDGEQTVTGLFIQDELTAGRATLTGGLRFDSYENEAEGQRSNSNERLSPRASFSYRVTDWLQPYVSYAEAFRAPGLSQLYNFGVHFPVAVFPRPIFNVFVPNPDLKPEVSRNSEIGVNLRFRDVMAERDSLRLRVSAFRNNLDDFIETVVGSTTTTQRNVTRARIQGLELEAQYEGDAWFGGIGASVLRGENLDDGQPLALIPAHKLSLTAGRRFVAQGLTLSSRLQLVDDQDRKPVDAATGAQPRTTKGYALLDAFLTYAPPEGALSGLRFDVGATNLTNTAYRRLSWDSGTTPAEFYDLGRSLRFAVRASF